MNAVEGLDDTLRLSDNQTARKLAGRLERLGLEPFCSDRARYLVLLEEAPGEIVDLGRPLKGTRLFKPNALKRDIATVRDIEAFARETGAADWLFWSVGLTGAKAAVGGLVEGVAEFNRRLNIELTELRKHHGFELILIALHPRYDAFSDRFDIHAHIICRVPNASREPARRRLMKAFSKVDLPDDAVRNAAACATYMLWGIFPPDALQSWPDAALAAAWSLTRARARLVRKGRVLGAWKRRGEDVESLRAVRAEKERRRVNRAATADPRRLRSDGDRLLARVAAKIGGRRIAALLFEECPRDWLTASTAPDCSSATCTAIQELPKHDPGAGQATATAGLAKRQKRPLERVRDLRSRKSGQTRQALFAAISRSIQPRLRLWAAEAVACVTSARGPPRNRAGPTCGGKPTRKGYPP